jgi:hypothetical protein
MNRTHVPGSPPSPSTDTALRQTPAPTPNQLLSRAAAEPATALDGGLRKRLGDRLGHDFAHVRIHAGPDSAAAADHLGARAYTLGRDVHLGHEARQLDTTAREQLLAHEAIHTVQQGARPVRPDIALGVSRPDDGAEREAHALAGTVAPGASPSLALRDRVFGRTPPAIQRQVAPHLQRSLTGKQTVKDGSFDLNLKTESHAGAKSGMKGTIKFTASNKAPDSKNIRLLQVVRLEDLSTGKEYNWTGAEADRNKMQTSADKAKHIQPGFFVDHSAAAASPRTAKADATVSPYYRDYWPNAASSQDGSKSGKTVKEASLWDYPGWSQKCRFTFETAAKAVDTGYIYATLRWGFTIADGAKGTVNKEHAKAYRSPSATFGAAVREFNEFYKNPGASTAPTK